MDDQNEARPVVVIDLKMPFGSMVVFMVKWAIAAIPALIILSVVGAVAAAFCLSIFATSGVTGTARVDSCIERGIAKMGGGNRNYVSALCEADPSISKKW